jgi:hypothetical protein
LKLAVTGGFCKTHGGNEIQAAAIMMVKLRG